MKQKLSIAALVAAFLLPATPTYAASEDECAIWLCLPAAFAVDGCGDAKDAFVDRVKHFKPPLPGFLSCMYTGELPAGTPDSGDMDSDTGVAAYIPPRKQCVQTDMFSDSCTKYEIIPSSIVKDERCRREQWSNDRLPRHCSKTINYVQTTLDGEAFGEPYYYDNSGNSYLEGSTSLED